MQLGQQHDTTQSKSSTRHSPEAAHDTTQPRSTTHLFAFVYMQHPRRQHHRHQRPLMSRWFRIYANDHGPLPRTCAHRNRHTALDMLLLLGLHSKTAAAIRLRSTHQIEPQGGQVVQNRARWWRYLQTPQFRLARAESQAKWAGCSLTADEIAERDHDAVGAERGHLLVTHVDGAHVVVLLSAGALPQVRFPVEPALRIVALVLGHFRHPLRTHKYQRGYSVVRSSPAPYARQNLLSARY